MPALICWLTGRWIERKNNLYSSLVRSTSQAGLTSIQWEATMPALKTLPNLDEPRVLLIGAEPWLISQTSLLFAPHQITVTALSNRDFLELETNKIDPRSVYKIIWWLEFADLELQRKTLEKLTQMSEIPIVVLGKLPEEFSLEHELTTVGLKDQQQYFASLLETLPLAQFFFSRDWVELNEPVGPMAFALRGMNNQLFLDPETDWFLTTRESFFEVVSPYFIRPPSPARVIVRGQRSMSTAVLKKFARLYNRYYQKNHSVIPVVASRRPPPIIGFVEAAFPVPIDTLLDEFARRKKQWQGLIQLLPSFAPDAKKETLTSSPEKPIEHLSDNESRVQATKARDQIKKVLINQEKNHQELMQEEKIEGELARIFHDNRTEKRGERIDEKVKIVKKIAKKSRKNKALFYGGVVTMVLGGLTLFLWAVFMMTTAFARRELTAYLWDKANEDNQSYVSGAWSQFLQFQTGFYQQIFAIKTLGDGGQLAKLEQSFLELQRQEQQLALLTGQYFLGILGKGETSPEFPPDLIEQLLTTQQTLSEVILEVESTIQLQTGDQDDWLTSLKEKQQQLAIFSQFPEFFSEIFGGGEKKTYAVLMQNNLELRPTGGFIQAVAFLVFDKGLLTDSQVVDIYQVDNRLPGSVQAPGEIQRFLGEGNWYLRDSNWNPDFNLAAQRAAWFIQQATGFRVDGVWALNYRAVQEILKATGPMELPEYDELLTEDNLLERVEFHSDDELASADPEKREYAVAVFSQLLRQLKEATPDKAGKILAAITQALQEKQILLNFTETDLQDSVRKIEWSGEIITPVCPTQFSQLDCLVDQVFQVEANIGLNRVNAYIRREVRHDVDFSGEKITHTRTVTLENTAPSQGWPLGTYKAYLRFILDQEAQPITVVVNGKKLAGENLMVYGEGGRKVVGVPVEVPIQSKTTLELNYVTEATPISPFSYLFFDQKQSGIDETPVVITFHNPGREPVLIAPPAELFGESLEFSLIQEKQLFVGASFQ